MFANFKISEIQHFENAAKHGRRKHPNDLFDFPVLICWENVLGEEGWIFLGLAIFRCDLVEVPLLHLRQEVQISGPRAMAHDGPMDAVCQVMKTQRAHASGWLR